MASGSKTQDRGPAPKTVSYRPAPAPVISSHGNVGASQPHGTAKLGPVPVVSSHGNVGASPVKTQSAGPAPKAAPVQSAASRYAQVLAATKGGQNPYAGDTARALAGTQTAVTGQILSAWFALRGRGLLPKTALPPAVKVDKVTFPGAWAYVTGGGANQTVHVSPNLARWLARSPPNARPSGALQARNAAREAIVHELAHTAQNQAAKIPRDLREGGAEAFANIAAPLIYSQQPIVPSNSADYARAAAAVNVREGNDWTMRGQFQPGGQAPTINAPGTRAFGVAMQGLGANAATSVNWAVRRATYPRRRRHY